MRAEGQRGEWWGVVLGICSGLKCLSRRALSWGWVQRSGHMRKVACSAQHLVRFDKTWLSAQLVAFLAQLHAAFELVLFFFRTRAGLNT